MHVLPPAMGRKRDFGGWQDWTALLSPTQSGVQLRLQRMSENNPLLSICIPTYNRGRLLRVMLEALLPQLVECGDQVEVWVLDNASTDETSSVIAESRKMGPFHSVRNAENFGPIKNVIKGPAELARGEFVWVIGDHNLMMPGAIRQLVSTLNSQPDLRQFYVNFRVASYPDNWPENANGGYDGFFRYTANDEIVDRKVNHWQETIHSRNYLGTQIYAHIVRTEVWQAYWKERDIPESYTDSASTYPHTHMIADAALDEPAYYIGTPLLTIFNGAQSWGVYATQFKVFFIGLPDLIELFRKRGLKPLRICDAKNCARSCVRELMLTRFQMPTVRPFTEAVRALRIAGFRHAYLWQPVCDAYLSARSDAGSRFLCRLNSSFQSIHLYLFYRCRPARWLRAFLNRT